MMLPETSVQRTSCTAKTERSIMMVLKLACMLVQVLAFKCIAYLLATTAAGGTKVVVTYASYQS